MKNIKLSSILITGIIAIFSVFLISTLSSITSPRIVSGADCTTYLDQTSCEADSSCLWIYIPEHSREYCRTIPDPPPPLEEPVTYRGTVTIDGDVLHYQADPAFTGASCQCAKPYNEDPAKYTPGDVVGFYYKFDGSAKPGSGGIEVILGGDVNTNGWWGYTTNGKCTSSACLVNQCINVYMVDMYRDISSLAPGPHTINFYVKSLVTEGSNKVTCGQGSREWSKSFTVPDTAPSNGDPDIDIQAPANNVWINYTPTFSSKIWDPDYLTGENTRAYYTVNSTPAISGWGNWISNKYDYSVFSPASLADGQWWWRAYAEDDESAWSGWSAYWLVKKDTVNPTATLDQENGISTDTQIWVNLTEADDRSGIAEGDVDIRINSGEWQDYASTIDDFIYEASGNYSASQGLLGTGNSRSIAPGDVSWTNPANAVGNDDVYTEAQVQSSTGTSHSESLNARDFGFSIPTNATINGIELKVDRKSGADVVGGTVSVTKNVGTVTTSGQGTGWNSNTFTRGAASDDWRILSDELSTNPGKDVTKYLKATNFGFAVPSAATIKGIKAEIEKSNAIGCHVADWEIKLLKAYAIQTTNKAKTGYWPNLGSEAYFTYGSSTDLWGTTWAPAQINSSNFGIAIRAALDDSDVCRAYLDHIKITVYYTEVNSQGVKDYLIKLVKDGALVGNNKAVTTTWPTTEATQIYGSSTDLWGTSWTAEQINAYDFGTVIRIADVSDPGIGYIDNVRMKVYYTAPLEVEGNTYEFRYRTKDNAGNWSDFSYDGMVTIEFHEPPTTSCNDNEIWDYCTDSLNPFLSWTYSDGDSDPQESYRLQIDNKSNFSSPILDTNEIFSTSTTYHPSGVGFNWDTNYYWRIKVKDDMGEWSDWSDPTCSFITPEHSYPKPDFSWAPTPATTKEVTQFVDETDFFGPNQDRTWSWTFESAVPVSSNLQNPVVSFSATGNWDVSLEVTDNLNYTCSITKPVSVELPLPTWMEVKP